MKKFLGVLLGCLISLGFISPVDALTTHKFEDWVTSGERGTKEKSSDNVTIIKGQKAQKDGDPNPCDGPFSKASVQKLEDGILEETYIELGLDKIKKGEYFEVDLGLKNASDEYVTEAVIMTEHGNDDRIKVYAGWAPNFAAYVTETDVYTYQWHMFVGNDGVAYVNFSLLKGEEVIGTTGDISLDAESIRTHDTKNPVAAQKDVSVKYLWFVHVNVADGIKVYSKLPGTEGAAVVQPTDTNVGVANVEKFSDVLKDSLKGLDIEGLKDDTAVEFELESTEVTPEDAKISNFKEALSKKAVNGTIANYFDISILIKDAMNDNELGRLEKLTENIELIFNIPEDLPPVAEGSQRVYYILREHEGNIDVLSPTISSDQTVLSFTSDLFSTYALAYEDIANQTGEVLPEAPNTLDKFSAYMLIATISAFGIIALGYATNKFIKD